MVDSVITERDVYGYLLDTFQPIYADLVAVLGEKPTQIIFQLEAALVHLAVASRNTENQHENCQRALVHLQRASLDAVKILWLEKKKELSGIIDDEYVRQFCVNTAESELLKLYRNAELLAKEARQIEISSVGINPNASIKAYYQSAVAYDEALRLVDVDKVRRFHKFHWKYQFRKHAIGFCLGVLASIVAALVFSLF